MTTQSPIYGQHLPRLKLKIETNQKLNDRQQKMISEFRAYEIFKNCL